MLSLLDGSLGGNANANATSTFIDNPTLPLPLQKVIKIQQVPAAQEADNVDPRGDLEFYTPEAVEPELKVEIPLDNGDRSFEDVSENILDKLLLSAAANGNGIDTAIDAPIVNQEEAQNWEESLNELFPDLI